VESQLGLSRSDNDPSLQKISSDASIVILLTSNKQNTTFIINGKSLNPAKTQKVLVPKGRLVITAQAPCYRPLMQSADADGFGDSSLFRFDFATWDQDRRIHNFNCS
jgi:hypothetical protein